MSQPGTPPPKVLVVEHETENLNVTARLLSRAGYQVTTADSADRALRILEADRDIGCAVVDLGIGIGGLEVVRWLRWARPKVHVIVMTSGTGVQLPPGVLVLPKPYTLEQLKETIDERCPVDHGETTQV